MQHDPNGISKITEINTRGYDRIPASSVTEEGAIFLWLGVECTVTEVQAIGESHTRLTYRRTAHGATYDATFGNDTTMLVKHKEKYLEIWERDGMPDKTVVLDFYRICGLTDEQQAQSEWEAIEDHELADSVPDHPGIVPYTQWKITSGSQSWMIYQWWNGSGSNDDEYLYVKHKQGSEA